MTQGEIVELFKAITLSYPSFRLPDNMAKEQVRHWHSHLKDVPFEVAMANLDSYVMHNRFPPTIADIRAGYQIERSEVPSVDETRKYLAEMDELRARAVPMPEHVREELRKLVRRA